MRILVLGSGLMGRGVAYDLARNDAVAEVLVGDIDFSAAEKLAADYGEKVIPKEIDAKKWSDLLKAFSEVDAVISCVSYTVNLLHTQAAIEAGTHMCDLGGSFKVVEEQLKLSDKAEEKGVSIIPDCGLAPGMVNVLVRDGIDYLSKTKCVRIRVGGLPREPQPPLNYSLVFSVEGLINEYVEPCMVLRDGKITFEDPLIGFEQLEFPEPYGKLEAFNTSGGTSTLPLTYQGKVDDLDYKTIRYPGHGHKMWTLMQLGFMNSEERVFRGTKIAPRVVLEELFKKNLPPITKDITLMRISIEGWKGTESRTIKYEMIDEYDEATQLTSMMRTTSFPAAIIGMMMVDGTITERGVLPPEKAVPPESFIMELQKRGIEISRRIF